MSIKLVMIELVIVEVVVMMLEACLVFEGYNGINKQGVQKTMTEYAFLKDQREAHSMTFH